MRHLIRPALLGLLAGCAFTLACSTSLPEPTVPQRLFLERSAATLLCVQYEKQPEHYPDLDAFCALLKPAVEVAPTLDGGDDAPRSGDSGPTADSLLAIDPARGRGVRSVE